MGRVYRTMQGKEIDIDKLISKHELMPAIGNARVNARGDEIGKGGKIIRPREQVMNEYYENNPKARPKSQSAQSHTTKTIENTRGQNESKRKN